MAKPLFDYQLIHNFPASTGVLQLEPFFFAGASYCGIQPSAWESSEYSWDSGDPINGETSAPDRGFGRWHGPGAIHKRPAELSIEGATYERVGHDDLARVSTLAASAGLGMHWEMTNPGFIEVSSGQQRLIVQDTTTGAIVQSTLLPLETRGVLLPALSGHVVVWLRIEIAQRQWELPPDYLEVRGFEEIPERFKYLETVDGVETEFVWDWEADTGRRPADKEQLSLMEEAMWTEYSALLLGGGLIHRGEWSQYITDGSAPASGGPWSALRVAVGDGQFTIGAGFQPAPGAVLNRLDDAATSTPICVDALALSLSAFGLMSSGEARVAGTIATRNGPHTAYWHFHPGESTPATLLGASERNYVPVCEASLYPTATDIVESVEADGKVQELVLSYSHLYGYAPNAPDITKRLPGVPALTLGHPGGRCLRILGGIKRWFTEFFGNVGVLPSGGSFAQFYSTLRTLSSLGAVSGKGTVFHGDNSAETFLGGYCGWVQDKPHADSDAMQYLARLVDGQWQADDFPPFPASSYRWQRLRSLGTLKGLRLIASGKEAASENAIWGVDDGTRFVEGALPFRARRLTRVMLADGTERVYALGRFVADGLVSLGWSVLSLNGDFKRVCFWWNEDDQRFAASVNTLETAGIDIAKLPAFLVWVADLTLDAGGVWAEADAAPEDATPYLQISVSDFLVAYAPGAGVVMPYDPNVWQRVCFVVHDDGSGGDGPFPPDTGCEDAQCAEDKFPPGSRKIFLKRETSGNTWYSIQISDTSDIEASSGLRKLTHQAQFYPMVWIRVDSDALQSDMSTYRTRAPWNRSQILPFEAKSKVEAVVIVPPEAFTGAGKVYVSSLDRRE